MSDPNNPGTRRWLHEVANERPLTRLNMAQDLKASARLIRTAIEDVRGEISIQDERGHETSEHLLLAFCFENLIKGLAIHRVGNHREAEELWRQHKSGHGFAGLIESFETLTDTETELLHKLEEFAIWAGRYPTSRTENHFDVSHWNQGTLFLTSAEREAMQSMFTRWETEILSVYPFPSDV